MKRKIKTVLIFLLLFIVIAICNGCWNAKELRDLAVVVGLGIDAGEQQGKVTMTAQIVNFSQLGSAGGSGSGAGSTANGKNGSLSTSQKAYLNFQNTGDTVFTALRNMTHFNNSKLYVAHSQTIVIGRALAVQGVHDSLDFLLRETETRPTTELFVADQKAYDVLNVQPIEEPLPSIYIKDLIEAQQYNSTTMSVNLQEFVNRLLSKTSSAMLPIIKIMNRNNENYDVIENMGVFKSDKLVGELDQNSARGVLWILNKVQYTVIEIKYQGEPVSIELESSSTDLKPQIKDGTVSFVATIQTNCNMMEQYGRENLAKSEILDELEQILKKEMEDEIYSALDQVKAMDSDVYGFGELIHKFYPGEWKNMEKNWDEIFKTVQLKLKIVNNITDTGITNKPVVPADQK